MSEPVLDRDLALGVRDAWVTFVDTVEPFRGDLFRFGVQLTGNPFDAEDLVHDALLRTFGSLGLGEREVRNPRAYLFRTLSNLWIDEVRRRRPVSGTGAEESLPDASTNPEDGTALRDAAQALGGLTPRERVAVVLKEGFDLSHSQIAEVLQSSEGAVKVALHRGRRRLRTAPVDAPAPRVSAELVDRFVAAFRAHDLDAMKALLVEDVEAEVFPSGVGWGREHHAKAGWLNGSIYHHIPDREQRREPYPTRLERREVCGERVVLVFRDPGEGEALEEVWLFEEVDHQIARIRDYCYCPDLVRWVGEHCGVSYRPVAYRYRPGTYRDRKYSSSNE